MVYTPTEPCSQSIGASLSVRDGGTTPDPLNLGRLDDVTFEGF